MEAASLTATALIALMKLRGVGRRAALKIVDEPCRETDGKKYREAVADRAERAGLSLRELAEAWKKSEEQLDKSLTAGIRAFSFHDEGYPARLREIPDPPAVLFVRGDSDGLRSPKSVAVVGTREPTPYGVKVALKSAQTAAEAGFTIVSGLAHGCDAYGHEGCLQGHGVGIAVMAHGLDRIYPAANRDLGERLLEHGGCLVGEYPVGAAPMRTAFAERDRIQSGLSDGVLVIETDVKGGTMHTVRFSRDQHRPLACIAHPEKWLGEDKTQGNQKLIKDGWAAPISDGPALILFLDRISSGVPEKIITAAEVQQKEKQMSWTF